MYQSIRQTIQAGVNSFRFFQSKHMEKIIAELNCGLICM